MGTVKYLLDTHTFLWAIRGIPKLSGNAKNLIANKNVQKFISAVSAYEIMYKHRIGKLHGFEDVAENYFNFLGAFGATELPISARHAHFAGKLEWAHRDPFDRLLAAQAITDNLTLMTNDIAFEELLGAKVLW